VIGVLLALAVVAIVLFLLGLWIFALPVAIVAAILFVLFLAGFGRRAAARGGP